MAEDGKIVYKVVINSDGVVDHVENVGSAAGAALQKSASEHGGAFKEIMTGAARHIGAAFVDMAAKAGKAVVDTVKAAVDSRASLEQNVGGVETLFKDSAETVIENAKRAYETAGLSANEYMETVTSFSASLLQSLGGDTEKAAAYADMAITDMSDNANKMGTDMQSIQNAYQGFAKQNYTMLDNLKLGYGGTKSEMERLVADAEKLNSSFKAQRDANGNLTLSYADVVDAIHIVQENMGITGTTAKEASETIEGSVNAMKAAYDNFLNGTGSGEELAEKIVTAANNIVDNVTEIAGRLSTEIPDLIKTLAREIPELAREVGPPLFDVARELLGSLVKTLLDGLPDMLDAGATLLENLLKGIDSESVAETTKTILTFIGRILYVLADHFDDLLDAGIRACAAIIDGFVQALTGHSVAELWAAFTNFVGEIVQFWKDKFSEWYEIGVSIVEGIKQGISDMWNDLVNSVVTWGWDLIHGFIDGIVSGWNDLKGTLGTFAGKIADYIGFSEPKEGPLSNFHTFAPDMMELYAKGIEDNRKVVIEQLGKLAIDARETLTMDAISPDFSSAGLARAVSYDINSSRMTNNIGGAVYNINVNGIAELDEVVNWFQSRELVGRMA